MIEYIGFLFISSMLIFMWVLMGMLVVSFILLIVQLCRIYSMEKAFARMEKEKPE